MIIAPSALLNLHMSNIPVIGYVALPGLVVPYKVNRLLSNDVTYIPVISYKALPVLVVPKKVGLLQVNGLQCAGRAQEGYKILTLFHLHLSCSKDLQILALQPSA